jgi:hypothetical protein
MADAEIPKPATEAAKNLGCICVPKPEIPGWLCDGKCPIHDVNWMLETMSKKRKKR